MSNASDNFFYHFEVDVAINSNIESKFNSNLIVIVFSKMDSKLVIIS
jgi:hypothetical protein